MAYTLTPFLAFKDNARQAMELYKSIFGGNLTLDTFKDFNASSDPAEDNLILQSVLTSPNGLVLRGADTPVGLDYTLGTNVRVLISGEDETVLRDYFTKLSEGGRVITPLETTMWGKTSGILMDKYGISWLINIETGPPRAW